MSYKAKILKSATCEPEDWELLAISAHKQASSNSCKKPLSHEK